MATRKDGDRTRDSIMDFMRSYELTNGFKPSAREIAKQVGVSDFSVKRILVEMGVEHKPPFTKRRTKIR